MFDVLPITAALPVAPATGNADTSSGLGFGALVAAEVSDEVVSEATLPALPTDQGAPKIPAVSAQILPHATALVLADAEASAAVEDAIVGDIAAEDLLTAEPAPQIVSDEPANDFAPISSETESHADVLSAASADTPVATPITLDAPKPTDTPPSLGQGLKSPPAEASAAIAEPVSTSPTKAEAKADIDFIVPATNAPRAVAPAAVPRSAVAVDAEGPQSASDQADGAPPSVRADAGADAPRIDVKPEAKSAVAPQAQTAQKASTPVEKAASPSPISSGPVAAAPVAAAPVTTIPVTTIPVAAAPQKATASVAPSLLAQVLGAAGVSRIEARTTTTRSDAPAAATDGSSAILSDATPADTASSGLNVDESVIAPSASVAAKAGGSPIPLPSASQPLLDVTAAVTDDGVTASLTTALPGLSVTAEAAASLDTGLTASASITTAETVAALSAQIARRLESRATRFEIGLTPDGLGQVDVTLDIDADGGLTARLAFDNPLSAAELRGRSDELRRQLQEAGFTVGQDALSFSERDAGQSGGRDGRSAREFLAESARAFAGAGRLNDAAETALTAPVWTSRTQTPTGVDVKV